MQDLTERCDEIPESPQSINEELLGWDAPNGNMEAWLLTHEIDQPFKLQPSLGR